MKFWIDDSKIELDLYDPLVCYSQCSFRQAHSIHSEELGGHDKVHMYSQEQHWLLKMWNQFENLHCVFGVTIQRFIGRV